MTQTRITSAADYAETLLVARKAKIGLTLVLILILIAELSLFFCLRYYKPLPSPITNQQQHVRDILQYVIGLIDFCGLIAPALLSIVLLLILLVQLVGRLLGTAEMTSAFLWSVLLVILLFPWQAVLNNPAINSDPAANALGMKIPGVIYTWGEISNPIVGATFNASDTKEAVLHWARYAGFPILTILILMVIQLKTSRSLKQSLGEEAIVEATTPPV